MHKLLDIVWHDAVESLVERRAWLAAEGSVSGEGEVEVSQRKCPTVALEPMFARGAWVFCNAPLDTRGVHRMGF